LLLRRLRCLTLLQQPLCSYEENIFDTLQITQKKME
jgi:hypothetical protein